MLFSQNRCSHLVPRYKYVTLTEALESAIWAREWHLTPNPSVTYAWIRLHLQ
jgi:hypothetical protein